MFSVQVFLKNIVSFIFLTSTLSTQNLDDLVFGDSNSLDIATWNIEWFPKNGLITVEYVTEIIEKLDLDVIAIQEVNDITMFDQMLNLLPEYNGYYESSWFAGLAFIYKTDQIEINDIYEIYTTSPYWSIFPRSPMIMNINFMGENYFIINNHFKCCGNGIIDFNNSSDEEYKRYNAINLIKQYIDNNLENDKVIVVGDLNDNIAEPMENNVFQEVLNDSLNYLFADLEIAQSHSSNWSYPSWPSHLDHILVTNELFHYMNSSQIQTIKVDEYLNGGWGEYDQNVSDHRPVAIKFYINSTLIYDINNDGAVNDSDLTILLGFIINGNATMNSVDINFDSKIDIFDLLILSDFFSL